MAVIKNIGNGRSEITLDYPIWEGDNKIEKIVFRNRMTWKDSKVLGEEDNQVTAAMKLFAALTIEPNYHFTTIEKLDMADANELSQYLALIVGGDEKKKTGKK